MRTDYLFYVLAAVFFVMTAVSLILVMEQTQKSLWIVSTVVLGLFSAGLGYTQRPKTKAEPCQPATPAASTPQPPQVTVVVNSVAETPKQENAEVVVTETTKIVEELVAPATPMMELLQVKGIGEKRAKQLKTIGISTVEALANVSANDVARDLKISPKIVEKWIANAKELAK